VKYRRTTLVILTFPLRQSQIAWESAESFLKDTSVHFVILVGIFLAVRFFLLKILYRVRKIPIVEYEESSLELNSAGSISCAAWQLATADKTGYQPDNQDQAGTPYTICDNPESNGQPGTAELTVCHPESHHQSGTTDQIGYQPDSRTQSGRADQSGCRSGSKGQPERKTMAGNGFIGNGTDEIVDEKDGEELQGSRAEQYVVTESPPDVDNDVTVTGAEDEPAGMSERIDEMFSPIFDGYGDSEEIESSKSMLETEESISSQQFTNRLPDTGKEY
jgi:hypothetical protein